ncbi:hypothetical protein AX17_007485 [Amanita inopinata Kibby_2008]|nr:hypothetical protein AX17_007485 [Amanita inopinata Kibby_2008]
MLACDLISSALIAQSIYYYLIPHYGSFTQLSSVTPEISGECFLSTLITFISQMYFVTQLYTVRKAGKYSSYVVFGTTILAFLAFAGGIGKLTDILHPSHEHGWTVWSGCVATMYVFDKGVLSNRNKYFMIFFGLAKAFGALTDIVATIAMCTLLNTAKTGMPQTNSLIKSLIQWVIQRGALVTFIQTALVISFYAAPTKIYWFAFHASVTKLYANTFFAMLNGRSQLQAKKSVIASRFASAKLEHAEAHTLGADEAQMPMVTKTVLISSS